MQIFRIINLHLKKCIYKMYKKISYK